MSTTFHRDLSRRKEFSKPAAMRGKNMAKEKLEETKENTSAVDAQPESTSPVTTPAKKSGGLKIVLIVTGAILVLGLGVVGYGFYNGNQIKKYATNNETMYNQTKKWDKSITDAKDAQEMKTRIEKVKSDSEKFLAAVEKTPAPAKEAQLKSNLREFYTLSKKLAGEMSDVVDWAIEIENVSKDMAGLATLDTSSVDAMITSLEKAKVDINQSLAKLDKMKVPTSIATQHAAMKDAFRQLIAIYDRIIVALRNNDLNALSTISSETSSVSSAFNDVEDTDKTIEKTYKADVDRLDSLDLLITADIEKYKNVGFSF